MHRPTLRWDMSFAMEEPSRNPRTSVTPPCPWIPETLCCAGARSRSTNLVTTRGRWIFFSSMLGSVWASNNIMRHYIRDGKLAQAKEIAEKFKDISQFDYGMVLACIENPSSADVGSLARKVAATILADPDPEPRYVVAGDFLFCGQKDLAVQLLKSSIAGHFCAYTGLQNDSVWAKLRGTPEFAELLSAAKQCRDDFLSQRSQAAH